METQVGTRIEKIEALLQADHNCKARKLLQRIHALSKKKLRRREEERLLQMIAKVEKHYSV